MTERERTAVAVMVTLGVMISIGLVVAVLATRGEQTWPSASVKWDAWYALQVTWQESGTANYSRYTGPQCFDAKEFVERARGWKAVCIPLPFKGPEEPSHGH